METYFESGSAGPIEADNLVEFHLLYTGPLHSAGHGSPRIEKHQIRKVFHSQLRHLWKANPNLREYAAAHGDLNAGLYLNPDDANDPDGLQKGLSELGRNWNRMGFNFLPLVTQKVCLRCSLEILFLRAEDKNYILQGGDIDGRIKTLFDALRIAREASELPPGAVPDPDENPFFCLLENDELISEVKVSADRLLNLPGKKEVSKSEVYLQITVRLNPTIRTGTSWIFE